MNEELDVYDDGYVEKEAPRVSVPKTRITEEQAQGIVHFIKYNNTIPIVLGVMFLTTTGALAASPQVRGAVYSSTESVKSVDNSYIRNVNIDGFPFTVQISNVREDADSYYVSYSLHTIDLVDSVWKPVNKPMQFSVLKTDLKGQNLGTYTGIQVAQVRDYERYRFTTAQQEERKKGPSSKVVATEYHGLIGAFLGSREATLPGYEIPVTVADGNTVPEGSDPNRLSTPQTVPTFDGNAPVISAPVAAVATAPAPVSSPTYATPTPTPTPTPAAPTAVTPDTTTPAPLVDTTAPVVSMLGASSITVSVGGTYTDLGAVASDNSTVQPVLHTSVNGVAVTSVQLPTSAPAVFTITYSAKDAAGNVGSATRTVSVVAEITPAVAPPEPVATPAPAPTEPPPAP